MATDSKAIQEKVHGLELMKASNIAIEKRMNENKKHTEELLNQKNSLSQSLQENEARLTWEQKSI
jgi:uncharacterized protein YoxC